MIHFFFCFTLVMGACTPTQLPPDDTSSTIPEDTGDSGTGLGLGFACATATECQAALICVHDTPDSTERTCVDPLAGAYDDGTGPDVQSASAWARKRVTDWESRDARCNDGSPYAYYISPGSGAGADNWLLFHKGGGICSSEEACAARWISSPQYMRGARIRSAGWSPGPTAGEDAGIFARDESSNAFADWNYVYFQYCSSDTFSGTKRASESEAHLWFRGHENIAASLDELIVGIDVSEIGGSISALSNATEVVIAGGSAGVVGARNNMDWMADTIRSASPGVRVRGLSDSVLVPPIHPIQYTENTTQFDFWAPIYDADCIEAHPSSFKLLCANSVHLTNGHGPADWVGGVDSGHLGVAASTESYAVEGNFTFMAQFDNGAFSRLGQWGICVDSTQCAGDSDCATGEGCLSGQCFVVEPCEPAYCTPDDEPCNGISSAPTCFSEVATHANVCDEESTTDCASNERCRRGFCIEDVYSPCVEDTDCPTDYACDRSVCTLGAMDAADCTAPNTYFEPDTLTCRESIGCSQDNACGVGYACLPALLNPMAQTSSWGVRQELYNLNPSDGAFAPNSTTHTAGLGSKYYGRALPKIAGRTFAETMTLWMADADSVEPQVSLAAELPLLGWTAGATAIEPVITARTSGSGCSDNAVGFIVCDVESACTASDAIAAASVGDSGTKAVVAFTPSAPVQMMLRVVPNSGCGGATVTPEAGAYLDLTHLIPVSGAGDSMHIALPTVAMGGSSQLLYVGADGATYQDRELTILAAQRRK